MTRVRRLPLVLFAALAVGAALSRGEPAADAPRFRVATTAGPVSGTLRSLVGDGTLEIDAEKRATLDPASWYALRRVGEAAPPLPAGPHLVSTAGDVVPVTRPRLDGDRLAFEHPDLDGGKATGLNLAAVSLLWWTALAQGEPDVLRRRLLREERKDDFVLLRNGDRVAGVPTGLDAGRVTLQADGGGSRPVDLKQVACLVLSSTLAEAIRPAGRHYQVAFRNRDGGSATRLVMATLTSDGQTLGGKAAFGATLRVPLDRVLAIDVVGGPADALTDHKPTDVKQTPFLDLRWPVGFDATATDHDLRLASGTVARGLATHAGTAVTYRLDGKYRRFDATVGLDPRLGREGGVRVEVMRDGKPTPLDGADLVGAEAALPVSIDVSGVKELTLAVHPGRRGAVQGHVTWAEPRLMK